MKVIVLDAAGVQGKAAIVYLLEQGDVSEIVAADISPFSAVKKKK